MCVRCVCGAGQFRFEVPPGETATLTLLAGSAEIFGAEMVLNRAYTFSGTQQAVFSWYGCTLEVAGQTGHSYVATETPMEQYLSVHGELDTRRHTAQATGGDGPRVLICGPADTGKSSLARIGLDDDIAQGLLDDLAANGVRVLTNTSVESFAYDDDGGLVVAAHRCGNQRNVRHGRPDRTRRVFGRVQRNTTSMRPAATGRPHTDDATAGRVLRRVAARPTVRGALRAVRFRPSGHVS